MNPDKITFIRKIARHGFKDNVPEYVITVPRKYVRTSYIDPDSQYRVTLEKFEPKESDKISQVFKELEEILTLGEEITEETIESIANLKKKIL